MKSSENGGSNCDAHRVMIVSPQNTVFFISVRYTYTYLHIYLPRPVGMWRSFEIITLFCFLFSWAWAEHEHVHKFSTVIDTHCGFLMPDSFLSDLFSLSLFFCCFIFVFFLFFLHLDSIQFDFVIVCLAIVHIPINRSYIVRIIHDIQSFRNFFLFLSLLHSNRMIKVPIKWQFPC